MADILVQRGTNDIGNTGGTDTGFTAVSSLTDAFEYNSNSMFTHGGSTSSGGNMEGDDMSGAVELTGTGTLTFTRQSGSLAQNMRFDWQLLEYTGDPGGANEFIVRSRNTVTLTGSSNTASLDTTPTDIDKCVPFITGVRTSQTNNQGDELRAIAYINDSGTLVVEKGSTTSTTVVQVVVVEFTGSNWSVYHGTATSATDTGTITLNTDSDGAGGSTGDVTDWATAFIDGQFTSTDQGLDSIACRYDEGAGTTTVDWDFQSGNSTSHKHFVHVVQNDDMAVTRYTPSGSNAGDTNIDITSAGLTVLSESFIIGTCQGSGGGTAYGRNWRNYRLTSLTNAQHYCHRSGNTINHNIQVIDFSAVEDSGSSPITGSSSITLDALTASSAAAVDIDGTASITLADLTSSSAGDVDIDGASAITLGDLTLSSDTTVSDPDITGEAAITLADLTVAGQSDVDVDGSLSVTLGDITLTSQADADVTGDTSVTLGDLTLVSAGGVDVDGTASITLGDLTLSSDVSVIDGVSGDLDVTLGALTLSSQADADVTGTASVTLDALTAASQGDVDVAGDLGVTLGDLTLNSDVSVIDGLAASLDATLDELTLTSDGVVDVDADAGITLGDLGLSSAGDVDTGADAGITLADLTLSSDGTVAASGGEVTCFLASPEGDRRANLTNLSWAWFDNPDPNDFSTPTDSGDGESTDASGYLAITLTSTGLSPGQTGLLVVRTDDGSWVGAYNLTLDAVAIEVILGPAEHANGGCIFGDPTDIVEETTPTDCRIVFDSPMHANGGCIFDDPTTIDQGQEAHNHVRFRDDPRIRRQRAEDDMMLAIIGVYMETRRWH